jgi:endo-1,4-beta-xylanase
MDERLEAQAVVYRDVLRTCLAAPNVTALVVWGVADHHSWIPKETGRRDAPLLFDRAYACKLSYRALFDVLAEGR